MKLLKKLFFIIGICAVTLIGNTAIEKAKENNIAIPAVRMEVTNAPKGLAKPLTLVLSVGLLLVVGRATMKS